MPPRDPTKDDRGRNPQRRSNYAQQETEKTSTGEAVVETDQTGKRKRYWQKPNNYIRGLTLLAVLTYTGVQIWQTALIRVNNMISQRAFVRMEPTPGVAGFDEKDNVSKLVAFFLPFINSGNTPTQNLSLVVRCIPSIEPLGEPWSLLTNGITEHKPAVIAGHAVQTALCTFSGEQMLQVKKRTLHAYVLAEAIYKDRLSGDSHVTEAEWELVHPIVDDGVTTWNGVQWVGVGNHNCADEECPPD